MNEMKIFEGNNVGIIVEDGEPLFEIYSTGMALGQVVTNAKGVRYPNKARIDNNLENAEITPCLRNANSYITESQLYDLMLEMKTDKVKPFRKWVTSEVLPSIRKHGAYMTPETLENLISNPDFGIRLLEALKEERQKVAKLEAHVEEKSLQLDESKQYYTVKRVAKINRIDWRSISWKRLKNTSEYLQLEVKKVFDSNFGSVNSYHLDVWLYEYPELDYETKPTLRLAV